MQNSAGTPSVATSVCQHGAQAIDGRDDLAQQPVPSKETSDGLSEVIPREQFLVTWQDEATDPGNPRNWPFFRRARALLAMSLFVFVSVFSTSMIAPNLPSIASDLGIQQAAVEQMILSVFLLGFAFGPLVASPLSETYGRVRIVQSWNLVYILFNLACAFAKSTAAMIVLRLLSGVFASATLGIGGGTLSDTFRPKERGKGVAVYSWCSILGPLFGVIVGGFIERYSTWHWTFYTSSILSGAVQIVGFFFLEETYAPLLLRRRKRQRIAATGDSRYYTNFDHLDKVGSRILQQNLIRPFKLLTTQPIVQALALYNAFLYGNTYIFYADFVSLWTERYHESVQVAGLNYVSIAISGTIATVVYSFTLDRIYRHLSKKSGDGQGRPEFRVPVMLPATVLLGVGMFWYGWSAEYKLHWIMPNLGCGLFIAGATVCTSSVNAYTVDTYGQYSASAIAAISILRCLAGFTFPLFAPQLYNRLGYSWGGSLIGFIALGVGIPIVWLLWKYGETLRARSPYSVTEEKS